MAGALRDGLTKWVHEAMDPKGTTNWWGRVAARAAEFFAFVGETYKDSRFLFMLRWPGIVPEFIVYSLTGLWGPKNFIHVDPARAEAFDMSKIVAGAIDFAIKNKVAREIAESYGAIYTEPFLAFFDQYAGREDVDPAEFIRALHGFPAFTNMVTGLASASYEALGLGQLDALTGINTDMQQSIGVHHIYFETIRPMIAAGLSASLSRYFNKKYRPKRFSASDLRDLYALGQVSQDQIREEARAEGWREQDIDQWIQLAFRTLSEGNIFEAYNTGAMEEGEAVRRLRKIGYDPADIPLLFKLNPKKDTQADKQLSAGDARTAFREGVVSEAQLRALLAALKYGADEIDVIVAIEKARLEQTRKSLSISQVRAAWEDNVITDAEVRHWLAELQIPDEQIEILLATWRVDIAPVWRKLNSGTVVDAYVEGVIARGTALDKLAGLGFKPEDADLELRLAEARNPEAFGQILPPKARRVTPGQLAELVALDLLTPAQMSARLQQLGYSLDDASLLAEAARLRTQAAVRTLGQGTIEGAYKAGVVDRAGAEKLLIDSGYAPVQARLILDTLEKNNPEIFNLPVPVRTLVLSPSMLEQLFVIGLIDEAEYRKRLAAAGLKEPDVQLVVEKSLLLLVPPPRPLTQSTIERAYLSGVFDRPTAYKKLLDMDFAEADANTILDTVEAANPGSFSPGLVQSTRVPSISVLVTALQNGILDRDTYLARAQELGFSSSDAELYISLAQNSERKAAKKLTVGDILAAYDKGIMPRGTALARITSQGYTDDDAQLLLRIRKESIQATDTWDSLLSGAIGPFDAIAALVGAKYADQDILDAFRSVPAALLATWNITLDGIQAALLAIPGGQ